ncbi:MAG: secretin N-terminal domain-containing protein [Betaproteobacteria bacterium]|uniref:secretin N-terminal domain-containing protein n=1 Tax=Acidiphilium TaxID=522 RepID=UPI00157A586C|nr:MULTISPECIES: secretin N-terminal domain-containing protein [Acidiphilium]MDE2343656.1 secretin N-terminal domain-containing protein [Betaproteobacteria bacterium]UNC16190.1 PilN family type IVB pilus formation outer membrane protein [Acidiphilium multivorum]
MRQIKEPGMIRLSPPRRSALIALALASTALSGCADFKAAQKFQNDTAAAVNAIPKPENAPLISTSNLPNLGNHIVRLSNTFPSVFTRDRITIISQRKYSLQEIGAKITAQTGIPVIVDVGTSSNGSTGGNGLSLPGLPGQGSVTIPGQQSQTPTIAAIAISYNGTIKGLLAYLESRYGVWSKYEDGAVRLYHDETKTFSIAVTDMPLTEKMSIVANAGGALGDTQLGGGMGGASNNSNSNNGSTTIKTQTSSNVWGGIQATATTLAGPGAKVAINPSMNSLTVYGTPVQVGRVSRWVRNLNRSMAQQVEISVHVYSITRNHEQNYGFNPAVAFNQMANRYGFSLQGVAAPSISNGVSPFQLGAFIGSGNAQLAGTTAAVQALATLGSVTETFEQNVVTMNHQPVPIQVAKNTGYLAAVSTTSTANVGSTNSLIPGNIATGFTGLFTPSVVDGRIMLTMNITLSSLEQLTKVSSGANMIEVPTSNNSEFSQAVSLRPGQTLLLTGYKQHNDQTTHNGVGSPFFALLGGGADATRNNQMIAITVTTRLLRQ